MTVEENGKNAVTHFQVLERFKDFYACRMSLRNGTYAPNSCSYEIYWLSTCRRSEVWSEENVRYEWTSTSCGYFRLHHPRTGEYIQFEAPIPEVFEDVLNILRK